MDFIRKILIIAMLMLLVSPVYAAKDYGKVIQSEARNTKKEIKKETNKIVNALNKVMTIEAKELPIWYPNADGSPLTFPLNKDDIFTVNDLPVLTSWYGLIRSDTNGQPYRAINIPAKPNSPVYAIADGVVTNTGDARYFRPGRRPYTGMFIEVTSKSGLIVSYEHLNNWKVCEGDTVIAGDQIGNVGGSGRTTGYHLRLVAIYNNKLVCISDIYDNYFALPRVKGRIWHCVSPGDLENVTIK